MIQGIHSIQVFEDSMCSLHVFAMPQRMRLVILHDFAPGCIFHYDKNKPEKVERDPNLVAKEAGKTFSHSSHHTLEISC